LTKNSLAVAIEALSWIAYEGIGERTALFRAAEQLGVTDADGLRQAHRLIMEVTRYKNRLDHLVSQSVGTLTIAEIPHGITSFLKILAFLRYVNRSSKRNLLRNVGWARQILGWRELRDLERPIARIVSGTERGRDAQLNEFERLSLETCHPAWFVETLIREFGRTFALKILRRNLHLQPSYVRLNPLKTSSQTQIDKVRAQLHGSEIPFIRDVWQLPKTSSALVRSKLIASGEIVIQDLASIAASLVASPTPGATILDVCAAPGNKTSHLAALMRNRGEIYSVEISGRRLRHWKKEMERTGTTIARPLMADAKHIPMTIEGDVVLVDPPCSNTGVFARSPSSKWKVTSTLVSQFAMEQYSIIQAASQHVSVHGTLVYCTCSILPEENEMVVENFLRRRPDFRMISQKSVLGSPGLRGFDLCQRFYTHIHDCDGYFIARLGRTD